MTLTLRVLERHAGGLVRLEGLPGWWRIASPICGTCGGDVWDVLTAEDRPGARLVCARCIRPGRAEKVARSVALPAGEGS
jgi:hypothetical protein